MISVVTIDGPAASGKSSVSRSLAQRLGWKWVSTGAFYRGLAWVVVHLGIDPANQDQVAAMSTDSSWRVELDSDATHVWFGDRNITDDIKSETVGAVASRISQYPTVRQALLGAQRQCGEYGTGLVAEGRDCGTVVFPDAQLKIYLTASEAQRAQRRAAESGQTSQDLLAMQKTRDRQDSSRQHAPLAVPPGAVVIDSSQMSLSEVVENIYRRYVDITSLSHDKT